MDVFARIRDQVDAVGLPMVAVSLTAVPRANTPVLLVLHWHGFARDAPAPASAPEAARRPPARPVPGSALQVSDAWREMANLDHAMLDAAWQFGAWDLVREEHRGCNTAGSSEREAHACRQAFADDPFDPGSEDHLVAEAPDRMDLMQLGARVGYVRWQFRPVKNGLWRDVGSDDSLHEDGGRAPPCPVLAEPQVGTRVSRTRYRLGRSHRLVLP
ncbi:MAG: diguanylate cyclase [Rhodoferax sp.]|nr:diguanylate cyclase [Rhodoferax sp.]